MKAFNTILKGFQKAVSQLETLAKHNHAQADAKMEQAEDLDNQAVALRDEAKAATQAALNIRVLVGDVK
ncbi:hypothetical protein [Pseudomonas sp. O230]|uniref:hypothetical protein n=1 Tax=Pseudomonas sp. O230 TaxID=3159450 RepID=UPI00387B0393